MEERKTHAVLLVESRPATRDRLAEALGQNGYTAICATDAATATTVFAADPGLELALIDIDLGPGKTGGDEMARGMLACRGIAVVFFTEEEDAASVARIRDIPHYGYVSGQAGPCVLAEALKTARTLFLARRRLERQASRLAASREAFRALAENNDDCITRYDRAGRHLYMNPAAMRATGNGPGAALGRTHRECGFPEELCALREDQIRRVFRTGRPEHSEYSISGQERTTHYDFRLSPEFDPQGNIVSVLGIARDITARRENELQVRDLALFPDQNPFPVARLAANGRLLYANRPAAGLFLALGAYDLSGVPVIFSDLAARAGREHRRLTSEVTAHERTYALEFVPIDTTGCVNIYGNDVTARDAALAEISAHADNLRITLQSIGDGVIATDIDGHVTRMNPAAEDLTGWTENEATGRQLDEVFAIIDTGTGQTTAYPLQRALASPGAFSLEQHAVLVARSGSRSRISDRAAPIRATDGTVRGMILVFSDITDRHAAEHLLHESELRYHQLFESMASGFALHEMIFDADGRACDYRFLDVNPAFEQLTGLAAGELLGRTVLEVLPLTEKSWIERYARVVETGTPVTFEDFSGELDRYYAVIAYRPQPGMFAVIIDDISERRHSELALRESESRFHTLFDQAPIGIFQSTPDMRFVYVNRAVVDMLGYASAEELMQTVAETSIPDVLYENPAQPAQFVRETDSGNGSWNYFEHRFRRKDGRGIDVRLAFTERADPSDHRVYQYGTIEDITASRQAINERARLEAQLRQEQKLAAVGTLANGVAHEINNPLMGVINYAQLIKDTLIKGGPQDRLIAFSDEIINEGQRISAIVRSLLAFSRQTDSRHEPTQPAAIIEAIMMLTRKLLEKDEIMTGIGLEPDLPPVSCNSAQIQQVLLNLLTNARDALNARWTGFSPDKRIAVKVGNLVDEQGSWVRFAIIDNGTGVPSEIADRIFDPFFTTKPSEAGTGLGLSISYGILKDHHGRLAFRPGPEGGSEFDVDLPAGNRSPGQ